MQADKATLLLASMLRSSRGFQSYDLSKAARERIDAIAKLLEEYEEEIWYPDYADALTKVEAAYRLLGTEPPAGTADDLEKRTHPLLMAVDKADKEAEVQAWQSILGEMADWR